MAGRRRSRSAGELGFRAAHRNRVEQFQQRLARAQGLHQELLAAALLLTAVVKQNPRHAAAARPLVQEMPRLAERIANDALREQVPGSSSVRKDR